MDELRRGGEPSVDIVPTDRMLLPPDREGMRRKASPCVECELRLARVTASVALAAQLGPISPGQNASLFKTC